MVTFIWRTWSNTFEIHNCRNYSSKSYLRFLSPYMTPDLTSSLTKWRTMATQKGDNTGSVTVIMHNPAATWGGDTCHARRPQSRRHSPTARSSQRHVPSATTARASQERKAEGKGERFRAKVSRNKIKEKPGVKQVSAERLRDGSKGWKLVY